MFGVGQWKNKPEMGLAKLEWVIVDEVDVLFGRFLIFGDVRLLMHSTDPDCQETTRQFLADISEAIGHPVTFSSSSLSLMKPSHQSGNGLNALERMDWSLVVQRNEHFSSSDRTD